MEGRKICTSRQRYFSPPHNRTMDMEGHKYVNRGSSQCTTPLQDDLNEKKNHILSKTEPTTQHTYHPQTLDLQKYNELATSNSNSNNRYFIIGTGLFSIRGSLRTQIRNYSQLENEILACQSHRSCNSHPRWQVNKVNHMQE